MPYESKVVVITGASAGVGRATVREFARNGFWIGLLARGSAGLEGAQAEVEALGSRALIIPADVADPAQVEAAAATVESNLGPIDIWINNAMVSVFSPVSEMSPEEFKRVTEVTYLGVVYGSMAALRFMRPRNRGAIVQVGSALSYRSIPLQSAYCGAKHAIRGFTDGLRSELHGAAPGTEYAAVRLGKESVARKTTTSTSDLPARSGGTCNLLGRTSSQTRSLRRPAYR
jgi:NAD(P)-dependent dehydrogenase (short-subunit alcohol dehydrogenase family)